MMGCDRCEERGGPFPICSVCGLYKPPVGRAVADAMANGMCDRDCPGYFADPRPKDLWPGERRGDAFPCVHCSECGGTGRIRGCNCGGVDIGIGVMHEPGCGTCEVCQGSGIKP